MHAIFNMLFIKMQLCRPSVIVKLQQNCQLTTCNEFGWQIATFLEISKNDILDKLQHNSYQQIYVLPLLYMFIKPPHNIVDKLKDIVDKL